MREMSFKALFLAALLLCSSACTTIHFRSSGNTTIPLERKKGHEEKDEVVKKKSFFLWGFVPRNHIVYVDREIVDRGYYSGANVLVSEYQTFWDFFFSCITLGMYIPKTYRLEFHGYRRSFLDEE